MRRASDQSCSTACWLSVRVALDSPAASSGGDRRRDDSGLRDGGRPRRHGRDNHRGPGNRGADDTDSSYSGWPEGHFQTPSVLMASSAWMDAMMAWIGMRPFAISWPPERRAADANGAA